VSASAFLVVQSALVAALRAVSDEVLNTVYAAIIGSR
jgi:hypothetical protein